uniref:Uncharacterized protein n=1 Tax=Setaria viridis TaxID=4556 RepID=A0A4U6TJK5_SETVI|nr:hypothetical protein SEVIR_8G252228v2 [Setaria viridis]
MQNRSRSSSAASLNRTQARTVCVPRPRPTRCGPTRQGWYKRPPPLPFSPKPQAFSHLQLPCAATRSICRHARAPLCALPSPLRRPHLHQKLRGKTFSSSRDLEIKLSRSTNSKSKAKKTKLIWRSISRL